MGAEATGAGETLGSSEHGTSHQAPPLVPHCPWSHTWEPVATVEDIPSTAYSERFDGQG